MLLFYVWPDCMIKDKTLKLNDHVFLCVCVGQAIIRLGDDGSFHMKNLGKYAISVNEKEVDPGQSLILKSDCLLEV